MNDTTPKYKVKELGFDQSLLASALPKVLENYDEPGYEVCGIIPLTGGIPAGASNPYCLVVIYRRTE